LKSYIEKENKRKESEKKKQTTTGNFFFVFFSIVQNKWAGWFLWERDRKKYLLGVFVCLVLGPSQSEKPTNPQKYNIYTAKIHILSIKD
jgi:hypothetical protein